jgi:hypothetical protein
MWRRLGLRGEVTDISADFISNLELLLSEGYLFHRELCNHSRLKKTLNAG